MSMLKLKINVNLPQLLCIVVSAVQNGEFENMSAKQTKAKKRVFRRMKVKLLAAVC